MVFNSMMVVSVAHASADAWQEMACIHSRDRLRSHQLLNIVFCLPLQQLGRLALCLWAFLCLPHPDSFYSYYPYSSTTTTSDDDDYDDADDDDDDYYYYYYNDEDGDRDDAPGPRSSSSSSSIDLPAAYYYHSHSD